MRRLVIFTAFIVLSMVIASSVAGQETCSSVVNEALSQLSNNCGDLPRNSACYGFNNVRATFFDALLPDAFSQPNDRADLATLQSINTSPLNIETNEWGIAVLKVQANLPDALPGQAVTFLLMGDVQLTTGLEQDSDQNPMQAVYFTTGINDTRCTDAPESSLIIQGPKDITVDLRVNGANIQLGSTAIFRSNADNTVMDCGVIDGAALVGGKQVIPAGFIASVPLDENLNTDGSWTENAPIEGEDATALQVLRVMPEGILNYNPDVPTADEIALTAALDPELVTLLDPDLLRGLVRLLAAENVTPEFLAAWDVQALRNFIADNVEPLPPSTEELTDEAFTQDFIDSLLAALDEYLRP